MAKSSESPPGRPHQRTELWAVIVLSLSALGSSYAGFQEGLWDGRQTEDFASASAALTQASTEKTLALQRDSANALHFSQWLNAYAAGNQELADFYRARFRQPFRAAFDQWLESRPRFNTGSPPTPLDVPLYREQSETRAAQFDKRSRLYSEQRQRDMEVSDSYGRAVMIFAMALFLGGIAQAFGGDRMRRILLVLAGATSVFGLATVAGLPMIRLM